MRLNKVIALLFFLTATLRVDAFNIRPVDGLWNFDSETSLAVGRAFNFELTGNVLVMTLYGYNAQRAPTFYVAAGVLDSSNRMVATMSEPQGGTCLGCAPTSGRLLSTPGVALFEFTTSTTGFVTLPGEARKAVSKVIVAWPVAPRGLLGVWTMTYMILSNASSIAVTDVVVLNNVMAGTSTGNGIVGDPTWTTICELKTSGPLYGSVFCVRLLPNGAPDKNALTSWWGDQMDGAWKFSSASATSSPYNFTAKRIQSANGDNLSLFNDVKSAPIRSEAAIRAAMEEAERLFIQSLANATQ